MMLDWVIFQSNGGMPLIHFFLTFLFSMTTIGVKLKKNFHDKNRGKIVHKWYTTIGENSAKT